MRSLIVIALLALLVAGPASAREELVTLPDRDKVSLTIYNSVDLTLVSEERKIAFKKGTNKLSFSWAGTRIDSTSVEFRALKGGEKLEVLDTTFPGNNPKMLVWKIDAEEAGDYQVEISYFTSGISWGAEYTGVLNADETSMTMTSYLTVTNNSGEDYEDAKIRVVIGTINLVQTLDELTKDYAEEDKARHRYEELRKYADRAARESAGNGPVTGKAEKKAIVKEGLGEYYIYTVGEGDVTENVPNRWSKRVESFEQQGVPVEKVFTYRRQKGINDLRAVYTFKNDEEHKLGKEPLPGGAIRLYKRKANDGLTFVASLSIKYIPKKEEVKITGEADPRITAKQVVMKYSRKNLSFRRSGDRQWVAGWDEHTTMEIQFANFTGRAVKVEYYLNHQQKDELRAGEGTELAKESTTEHKIVFNLAAGTKAKTGFTLIRKLGTNAR